MINQVSEDNGVNRTGTECEGSSPGRCFPAQRREPGRHPDTARMKWNKEVNTVVMECFYRSRPFDEKESLSEDVDKGCFETGKTKACLNQLSNVCVIRQGPLGRMGGYQNWS